MKIEKGGTVLRQLRRVKALSGYAIKASDGALGHLEEIYFDDGTWAIRYFIIRTGTWFTGRKVLVPPVAITHVDENNSAIHVSLTMEQVQHCPPIETEKPISRQYEKAYYQYYGWAPYWETGVLPSLGFPPTPAPLPGGSVQEPPSGTEGDPHLRSTGEITGYYIGALDGEIGHVEDFILDDQSWMVRYLEIDTRNWLPGKKILLATAWVKEISWEERRVHIDLSRERVRFAPAYKPDQLIDRDYELQLFKHYGKALDPE